MKMPKVGITCYPNQGGSGVVASELGLHLARRGCEIHFISSSLPFRLRGYEEKIFYHQVDMPTYPVFLNSPYTLSLATVMSEVAVRHGLDLLHVHYAIPHAASAYLARQMLAGQKDLKVVTTLHGTDITLVGQEPSFRPITRFVIQQSDAVTAVSTFLKEETIRHFECREDIHVIPNFVDARIFQPREPANRPRLFGQPGEKLLLHASNFRKVKNLPAVVEVFARVAAKISCRLLLVGDGPELVTVREELEDRKLNDRVEYLGHVNNLERIMPEADLLLLPSLHESFGLVALEAMSCGVIPLVTSRGGAGEFVQDGINGFLRDPEDLDGMTAAALQILGDDSLRQHMGEEARRDAAGDFGVSCVVKSYLELYDQMIGAGG
jgi:L-malate glycosyltransferase